MLSYFELSGSFRIRYELKQAAPLERTSHIFVDSNNNSKEMRLFHEASIKSISLEKFGSEVENDRDIWRNGVKADKIELGGIIVPQGSIPRQSVYRKLRKAWLLLLSFAVLHYVYLGTFLPRYSIRSHQTPNLHFSTATGTRTTPVGLFIDRYNIWHIYLQC